jgi:hypothetical protein
LSTTTERKYARYPRSTSAVEERGAVGSGNGRLIRAA